MSTADNVRVWNMQDLNILDCVENAICVNIYGLYEDQHSIDGVQETCRVVYQNAKCLQQLGLPRPHAAFRERLHALSQDKQRERRAWVLQIAQASLHSTDTQQTVVDLAELTTPAFEGTAWTVAPGKVKVDSKSIRLQTSPGKVEAAIMHVIHMDSIIVEERRLTSMLQRNPLHTFMFAQDGKLVVANKAAMEACQHSISGLKVPDQQDITLQALFRLGQYAGGSEEADKYCAEAMHAVFEQQQERYSHVQCHEARQKDGQLKTRWECIEMWPMQDPITDEAAVLVKRYNITQGKELELELAKQKLALQRHNQELEQSSANMQQQNQQLEHQAHDLAQRLDAVLQDKFKPSTSGFDADTPIDKTLNFLQAFIAGQAPLLQTAMDLYHLLGESSTHLRQPVALETQLLEVEHMDTEVGNSMLQLLQGSTPKAMTKPPASSSSSSSAPTPAAPPGPTAQQGLQSVASSYISAPVTPVVERLLKDAETNWQFDIFALAEQTPGHTLSTLAFHYWEQLGWFKLYPIDIPKFCKFIRKIESGYMPDNPYHNSVHAAAVLQTTQMLVNHGGMPDSLMDRVTKYSSLFAAMVHDYQHGGLTNDFLIKTHHPYAILYNDQSPLENHHCAATCKLVYDPEFQYLPSVVLDKAPAFAAIRQSGINQVLGTDMKKHFDITSRFQAAFNKRRDGTATPSAAVAAAVIDWENTKPEDKTLVHQMVLKCADIGHLAVRPRIHMRWAHHLEEEFFRQGDKEKALGMAVSPLMDRATQGGMTRSQLGFFNIVGIPMFKAMAEVFEGTQPLLDGVMANYHHWEAGTPADQLPE